MKVTIELPKGAMCCFVNYIYSTESGMLMGCTSIDGDDLLNGHKICKGAEGYEEAEVS